MLDALLAETKLSDAPEGQPSRRKPKGESANEGSVPVKSWRAASHYQCAAKARPASKKPHREPKDGSNLPHFGSAGGSAGGGGRRRGSSSLSRLCSRRRQLVRSRAVCAGAAACPAAAGRSGGASRTVVLRALIDREQRYSRVVVVLVGVLHSFVVSSHLVVPKNMVRENERTAAD